MRDKRINALEIWLAEVLLAKPEIITKNITPNGVYADLQTEWLKDIQPAFKNLYEELNLISRRPGINKSSAR